MSMLRHPDAGKDFKTVNRAYHIPPIDAAHVAYIIIRLDEAKKVMNGED